MSSRRKIRLGLSSKLQRDMDDSSQLVNRSQKLLSSLQERRGQIKPCPPINGQENQYSTNKTEFKNNHFKDSSKSHEIINSHKTPPRISSFPSMEASVFHETKINGTNPLVSPRSAGLANIKNASNINSDGITVQAPTNKIVATPSNKSIEPPPYEDIWMEKASLKSPNNDEISVPKIVIWSETQEDGDVTIDIAEPVAPPLPQASISTPQKPLPPPPPVRSVTAVGNSYSFSQPEDIPLQNGTLDKIGIKDFEKDLAADREENCSSEIHAGGHEEQEKDDGVSEEKKQLLYHKVDLLNRRTKSTDNFKHFEKNPTGLMHRRQSYALTVTPENAEHPTMGQSLNVLANQALQNNETTTPEEKGLEVEPPLVESKPRRSFCDMLLEIPRKLSHVSDGELGHVPPILKRGLGNRKGRKSLQETTKDKRDVEADKSLKDCFFTFLSGIYGLVIVVLGAVIPISETFAEMETPHFFDAFYIYLFTCSSLFILYVYTFLLRRNKKTASFKSALNRQWSRSFIQSWSFTSRSDKDDVERTDSWYRRKITTDSGPHNPNGSFYLRLGAVGFGIGGMIHSGLQLGMHFEGIGGNTQCDTRIQAVKPLFHLIFTFSQLYFVFLNPKVCIHRYKTFARFGLMHMCGTNICVWFRNIVVETLHEMHHGSSSHGHHSNTHDTDGHHGNSGHRPGNSSFNVSHHHHRLIEKNITQKAIEGLAHPEVKCYWTEMMGNVVNRASPYLYPCSIEYSLICAGIMYVLWQQVGRGPKPILVRVNRKNEENPEQMRSNRMSVDCGSSSRGLFVGILLFVGAVITMVAFYVLVHKENMTITALTLVHLSEITIYLLGVIASLAAAWRMRNLSYHPGHASVLENVLILISLTGVFIFCIFGIIAAIFHTKKGLANALSIASNLMMVFQSIIQTVFMVVAAELQAVTPEDVKRKPGREYVTFLILCNLSLWGINTFETQRAEHNPIQTDFYGHMAWAILTHISVPLGIFYRFHSTVCLSNIWKNAWKDKKH